LNECIVEHVYSPTKGNKLTALPQIPEPDFMGLTSKGMGERIEGKETEWKGKGGGRGMITRIRDVRTCQP